MSRPKAPTPIRTQPPSSSGARSAKSLADLCARSAQELIDGRYDKFRHMGNFFAEGQGA